ncbi:TetR/AcrR family transcriptional regulator [Sinomonas sp. ASV486]|uniref:TetR/AcrR family transcriptional regulator n=1 Tax=Sinomonas sp. ASV486 TaxID=3051170 RepID=UPI0027DD166E|nr:TetR/AcrR family transcriptional regulator [Sinomonas sp. ASV486]MDQ4490387.1 TetR/AcrR family transcriptional regulator [Sinomonas sp. ASV486]
MTTETPSRREQNKAATRESIIGAGLSLATARGLGGFTVEELADAAGVSRRTFFNYFSSVEEAIAAPTFGFLDTALGKLTSRPADEALLDSALHVLTGLADNDLIAPMAQSFLLAVGHDPVTRYQLQAFDECGEKIAAAIRAREPALGDLYVAALSASVIACGKSALEVWLAERSGDLSPSSLARLRTLLREAITHLRAGFAMP